MKEKIIQYIKVTVLALILVFGVNLVYASYTAPRFAPPDCPTGDPGCDAPVNVSITSQTKTGPLTLGGLGVLGDFKFLPSSLTPPTAGQVLMADETDLALGKVKWGTVSGGGGETIPGGTVTNVVYGNWENVPLTDTADFDIDCEYRVKTNGYGVFNAHTGPYISHTLTYYYASNVTSKILAFLSSINFKQDYVDVSGVSDSTGGYTLGTPYTMVVPSSRKNVGRFPVQSVNGLLQYVDGAYDYYNNIQSMQKRCPVSGGGASAVEYVTCTGRPSYTAGSISDCIASCSAGKKVTGGGCTVTGGRSAVSITQNGPVSNNTGWGCATTANLTQDTVTISGTAICQ